jgi:hypothetical protein
MSERPEVKRTADKIAEANLGKSIMDLRSKTIKDDVKTKNNRIKSLVRRYLWQESISEYLQEALVEAMRFDLEEGNFCEALLEKISSNDKVDNNSLRSSSDSLAPDLTNSDLDLLTKLQT